MNDLVVIMPVYKNDRLEFLKESVESILTQTFRNFDYFIICDGPVSDGINSYLNSVSDHRVRLFRLERNSGLAAALNHLLEIILKNPQHEFIARMDADDISASSRFEKQLDFLLKSPEISCVGAWYEEIDENGKHISYRKLPVDPAGLRRRYYFRTPFAHSSVMYRRELIEKAGFYPVDTMLMEDNVLWGRALSHGLMFANIPEFLLKFRIDRHFFKRRSGFRYGRNYIKSRYSVLRGLSAPFYAYVFTACNGLIRMVPQPLFKLIYRLIC